MSETRKGIIRELFKKARRNYPRMKVVIKGLWETLNVDLVDMQKYAKQNNGYKYILTCMDGFSKYAFAVPVKDKSGPVVTAALKSVLDQIKHPVKKLFTDEGKEFYNSDFQKLMKDRNITHYHTYSGIKNPLIERFNRTLRQLMNPELMIAGNSRWTDILDSLIDKYNHTRHRTIKMTPAEATDPSKEKEIWRKVYRKTKIVKKYDKPKFKVGDFVRVSTKKLFFEKGTTANYSLEIFRVAKVKLSNPRTYLLEDMDGKEIKGRFYEPEMQKTKYPHQYIVEKVIKKTKNKYLVKYLGWEKNYWIDKKDFC